MAYQDNLYNATSPLEMYFDIFKLFSYSLGLFSRLSASCQYEGYFNIMQGLVACENKSFYEPF